MSLLTYPKKIIWATMGKAIWLDRRDSIYSMAFKEPVQYLFVKYNK